MYAVCVCVCASDSAGEPRAPATSSNTQRYLDEGGRHRPCFEKVVPVHWNPLLLKNVALLERAGTTYVLVVGTFFFVARHRGATRLLSTDESSLGGGWFVW